MSEIKKLKKRVNSAKQRYIKELTISVEELSKVLFEIKSISDSTSDVESLHKKIRTQEAIIRAKDTEIEKLNNTIASLSNVDVTGGTFK